VLVVDDEPAVADSMAVLLEMDNHEVRVSRNGEEALKLVPAFRPHVVFLDVGLVAMDGFEVASRLRQIPEGRDACVVAITGYGDERTGIRAREAGCDHYLVKPVNPRAFTDLLVEAARKIGESNPLSF
jgi:DNA-binding response OmpR family regulator